METHERRPYDDAWADSACCIVVPPLAKVTLRRHHLPLRRHHLPLRRHHLPLRLLARGRTLRTPHVQQLALCHTLCLDQLRISHSPLRTRLPPLLRVTAHEGWRSTRTRSTTSRTASAKRWRFTPPTSPSSASLSPRSRTGRSHLRNLGSLPPRRKRMPWTQPWTPRVRSRHREKTQPRLGRLRRHRRCKQVATQLPLTGAPSQRFP